MEAKPDKLYRNTERDFDKSLTNQSTADATGLWFAAAAMCAFLTAGVIVYRTGSSDFVVAAANNVMPTAAAKSGPFEAAPIFPQR